MKVCETFGSIQGEGKRIGVPTFFIRTAGCNLDCSWCDTKYAFGGGEERSIDELCAMTEGYDDVCLTGGEPLLQRESPELIARLTSMGKTVVIETNGSVDVSVIPDSAKAIISMDIKCPSSGMEARNDFSNIARLTVKDQLKFVLADVRDYDYAVGVIDRFGPRCECIFSPVGGMDIRPLAERIVSDGLKVRVLPQLHKIIWGDRKGV